MNAFIFVLLILFTNGKCSNQKNRKNLSEISIAFENITSHLNKVDYDIFLVNYGKKVDTLASSIMKKLSEKEIPYNFKNLEAKVINVRNFSGYPMNGSGVLTFDSVEAFKNFSRASIYYVNKFAKQFQFFVFCLDATFEDLNTLSDIRLKHFFSFLLEDDYSLKLMTFIWYFPGNCNISQLIKINRFIKTLRKWESQTFSIDKNRNFYGCPLAIGWSHSNLKKLVYGDSSQSMDLHKRIFSGLSKNMNYSLEIKSTSKQPNVSIDIPISFASLSNQALYQNKFYNWFTCPLHTRPYIFRSFLLAVPIGEEYNDFEKLLMPFDSDVWNWIILTFSSAFVVIFILKFAARARIFIIGATVQTPSLNVLMIFSGTSQVTMPGRNFARFLVMQFIIFSMIIRTAWQGKMFEFLQQEIRKPEVQTIDEMIEKNFTFYMTEASATIYNESDFSRK